MLRRGRRLPLRHALPGRPAAAPPAARLQHTKAFARALVDLVGFGGPRRTSVTRCAASINRFLPGHRHLQRVGELNGLGRTVVTAAATITVSCIGRCRRRSSTVRVAERNSTLSAAQVQGVPTAAPHHSLYCREPIRMPIDCQP
jgi:hypothetical protein